MAARPVHRQHRRPAQHRKPRPAVNPALGAAGRLAGCSTVAAATTLAAALSSIAGDPNASAPTSSTPAPPADLSLNAVPAGASTPAAVQALVAPVPVSAPVTVSQATILAAPEIAVSPERFGAVARRTTRVTARTPSSARTAPRTAKAVSRSTRTSLAPGSPAARIMASPSRRAMIPTFRSQAARHGVRTDLLMATCWQESGWQARVVSSAGAVGVCQIMPRTAEFISQTLLGRQTMNRRDPVQNITMSAAYQRYLLKHVKGDSRKMLASYYQGLSRTQRSGLLPETVRYVRSVQKLQPQFAGLAGTSTRSR